MRQGDDRAETANENAIKTVGDVFNGFPVPKPKTAKDKKELEAKKKAEAEQKLEDDKIQKTETVEKALENA